MSVQKVYTCSVCGVERKTANHWFVAIMQKAGYDLRTWDWAQQEGKLEDEKTLHLCGQVCVNRLFDKFMNEDAAQPAQERG